MKTTNLAGLSFLCLSLFQVACASERILDVRESREITREEFLARIADSDDLIVGEKHDTAVIQAAEARLFTDFANGRRSRVTFAWEFWNWSEREVLQSNFEKFRSNEITGDAFLRAVFGEKNPQSTYLPLMEAVKAAGADVLATNLTRKEKAPVVRGGLGSLDPALLPPGFELGGAAYQARFYREMQGHAKPEEIANYFAAQCLVDDVAAYHFAENRTNQSAFLVIGSFHTRYFDGVWSRIEKRSPGHTRTLVEIAEPGDESDWPSILRHRMYGPVADFMIFVK